MIPINEEVAIKQEILEISLSSLSGALPTLNAGSSGKKKKHEGPKKRTTSAKSPKRAPRTATKPGISTLQASALSNKLTVAQKDALRLAFTSHTSVPSLASRSAWASANCVKGDAVHRYCRYLRGRSRQILVKQEPDTEPQVEAEWHLSVNIATSTDGREIQAEKGQELAPVLLTDAPKSHQPAFPANLSASMTSRPHAVCASEPSPDSTLYPEILQSALESIQMPDFSFLSDTYFFDLLTGPAAIIYDDLRDPITFCMKFQDSYCSLDMEVAHEALRTMYFFEGAITGQSS